MKTNIFDKLSFLALFLVVVLLPVFCLPFVNIPVEISKGLLLVLGLTACIVFWAIARFTDGKIILPRSWLLVSGFGISLTFLLSALFSKNSEVSLFGTMFDIGSFWFIFSAVLLMLLSSIIFRTPKQAKIVLLGTILSSVFVLVFQILHFFIPKILSLGILVDRSGLFDKTLNIIGSLSALGLFAGFAGLMFLLVVEFFSVSKIVKIFLQIFIILSILMAAAVNFSLVWILLGISSLIIFVYKISITLKGNEEKLDDKIFPVVSFMVVMVSLLFFLNPLVPSPWGPVYLGDIISSRLQISNTEISPNFVSTLSVTKEVLTKNPIFGIGPNRFGEAWSMYKPADINKTNFWDASFNSGSGLLPTLTSTTGFVSILAWIIFFVLFLMIGLRSLFSSIKNGINWEMMAFFVLSLYLFIASFFYSTGSVLFLLAFAFAGVFIGLISSNYENEITISFLSDHRKSFFSILGLILLIVASLSATFKYIERFTSVSYFEKALSSTTESSAENYIKKALQLYQNDLYWRTFSQIYLVKLNSIVDKGSTLSETDKNDFKATLEKIKASLDMAIEYNPSNYLNFQLQGSVYQSLGPIGINDAYSGSVVAYQNASNLNPINPGLQLAMASASLKDGKVKEAKVYAGKAISLKRDYIDAFITLSQISKSEGDNAKAFSYAESALILSPTDKNLIQYVNSLKNPSSASVPVPDTTSAPSKNKK